MRFLKTWYQNWPNNSFWSKFYQTVWQRLLILLFIFYSSWWTFRFYYHKIILCFQHPAVIIIRRNRVKANLQISPVGSSVRSFVTVFLGNRWTYFPEILHRIRKKKKENFAQGPIFHKKWLKIAILISAYCRILPFLFTVLIFIYCFDK